ncbi:hypothetical protein VPNG_08499 [Cytospora leucostoma]|uniref:Uncharacterized protein n=1 Tax=Cytospora leucostoma TaxID=1230097 RepID=A0A423W5A0_9PEZI|nr:hypothetical protein VPNG_08499 [Cytospora leucostoma]
MPPITLTTRRKRDNIASFEELMTILEIEIRDWGREIGNPVEAEQQLLDAIRQAEDNCQYNKVLGREDEISADLFLYKACIYAQDYRNIAEHRLWNTPEVAAEFEEPALGPAIFVLSKSEVKKSLRFESFDDWRTFMMWNHRFAIPSEKRPESSSGQRDTPTNPSRRYNEQESPARGGMRSGPGSHSRGESVPRGLRHQQYLVDREYMPRGVAGRSEGSRLVSRSSLSNRVADQEMRPSSKKTYSGHQRHGSAVRASLTMRSRRDDPRIESSEHTRLGVDPSRQRPMDSERTQKIHHSIPTADELSSMRDSDVRPRQAKHRRSKNKALVSSSPNNTDVDEESGSGARESHAAHKKYNRRSGRAAKGKKNIAPSALPTAEVSKPDDKVYQQLPEVAKPEVSGKAPSPVSMGIEQRPVTEAPKYLFGEFGFPRKKVNMEEPQPLIESQLDELWRDQLQLHDLDKPGVYGLKPSQLGPWSVPVPLDVQYNEHIREAQAISNWTMDGLSLHLETHSRPDGKPFQVLCIKLSNYGPVRPKTTAYSLHRLPWLRRAFWRTYLLVLEWVCNMYRKDKIFPLADFILDRSGTNKNDNMMEREAHEYLGMVTKEAKFFHGYKEQSVQPTRNQKTVQRQAPSSPNAAALGDAMNTNVTDRLNPCTGTMSEQARKLLELLGQEPSEDKTEDVTTQVAKWVQDVEDGERKPLEALQEIWALKERFPSLVDLARKTVGEHVVSGMEDGDPEQPLTGLWGPLE